MFLAAGGQHHPTLLHSRPLLATSNSYRYYRRCRTTVGEYRREPELRIPDTGTCVYHCTCVYTSHHLAVVIASGAPKRFLCNKSFFALTRCAIFLSSNISRNSYLYEKQFIISMSTLLKKNILLFVFDLCLI